MVRAIVPLIAVVMSLFSAKAPTATNYTYRDLTADDRAAIEFVIREQLMAFRQDDAATAFHHAAANVREKLQTPAALMALVRTSYSPIYCPRAVEFGALAGGAGGPVQVVFLIGPDDRAYTASYHMQRQSDGTWKIAGCYLDEIDARAA